MPCLVLYSVVDLNPVALVAQLVERSPREQSVVGPNPTTQGSSFFLSLEKGVVLGGIDLFALPLPCCLFEFLMHQ